MGQLESFGCDADVGYAHAGHEQCRNESDDIGLILVHQVYGDGPKGEYREGLVAPGKVAPDDFESVSIGEAIEERGCSHRK